MKDFEGRVVLVTGACGNLGSAVVTELQDRGAAVVCADAASLSAGAARGALQIGGLDLAQAADARAAVSAAVDRFGRIDALVNTIGGFRTGRIGETALDDWEVLFSINARIALTTSAAVIPGMTERHYGRIVHVAAAAGLRASAGVGVYSAAKSAVLRIAEAVAEEQGSNGIVCNCILPGVIDTPQNRAATPGADRSAWVTPASIAKVAAFLASESAGSITGAAIPVTRRDAGGEVP